jgi:dTDP-4-amino-4,6-dideoxygalactose transaminase
MIPLIDLKAQYHSIKKDIDRALVATLESGHFSYGDQSQAFEKEFASYLGSRFCVGLNSGTDALILGLRSLHLKPGDEIIVPANTYVSAVAAIMENNLRPVFVDINEDDYGINLDDLQKKISTKTSAVIVAHMFGLPDNIDEIRDIIAEADHTIHLIEDASYAQGALYKDVRVGTFGIFSVCSFHPKKNLGGYGDGAALVTNDPKIERLVRLFHDYGQDGRQRHTIMGISSQLDEIQAAVLRVKLIHLDMWNSMRAEAAGYYAKLFQQALPFVKTPQEFSYRMHTYNSYVVQLPDRDRLMEYLKRHGIQSSAYYPTPIHLQKGLIHLNYVEGDMPVAEHCAKEMLELPMYPELTADQCRHVVEAVAAFYS